MTFRSAEQKGASAPFSSTYTIMGVDPGTTTGMIVLTASRKTRNSFIASYGTLAPGHLEEIRYWLDDFQPDYVVVERIPGRGPASKDQQAVYAKLKEVTAEKKIPLLEVSPAQWKPWAISTNLVKEARELISIRDRKRKGHVVDAYCLTRHAVKFIVKEDYEH